LKSAVDTVEREMIKQAMKRYNSTRKAAKTLGVSQPTIIRKMRLLGISNIK
jgi:TyrR family helix-turn-helix protein